MSEDRYDDVEPHRKVGRRFSDHAFYWMPLILGTISLLSSIVIVIGAYWSIRADVQLLSWRMSQVESRLEQLMNRTQQSRNNPTPEP